MPSILLLDIDGVLLLRDAYFSERFSREHHVPMERILPFFHGPYQDCVLGRQDIKQELLPFLAEWGWTQGVEEFLRYWHAVDGAPNEELLQECARLRASGTCIFLATDNEPCRLRYILEEQGLSQYCDGVFASCAIGCSKEDPAFWTHVLQILGVTSHHLLFIDDDEKNVACAVSKGVPAAHYCVGMRISDLAL